MDLDKKVLTLENRIIDFFTMFTWWTDVRWNKDNLHFAASLSTVSSFFVAATFSSDLLDLIEKKNWFLYCWLFSLSRGLCFYF